MWGLPWLAAKLLYQLAQSKRACAKQVYLIPKANWFHLKIYRPSKSLIVIPK